MAERIELFTVTIPAGTPVATPVTQQLPFNPGHVRAMEITVPPGPSGLMGFKIGHSAQIIIPDDATTWLVTDNERISWNLAGYPTGNSWFAQAYNTGMYDHTIYLRMLIDEFSDTVATYPAPIPIG